MELEPPTPTGHRAGDRRRARADAAACIWVPAIVFVVIFVAFMVAWYVVC